MGSILSAAIVAVLVSIVLLRTPPLRGSTPPRSSPPTVSTVVGRRPTLFQAEVTIPAQANLMSVPRSFLGISTEYWTLPVWANHMSLLNRVLSLVRANGPLVLRIGGDSADHAFWAPVQELPEWIFEITPSWVTQVSTMVHNSGVRLILDLNLVTATPSNAARWARTAESKLPHGSIIAFEIGNEPDIYSRISWQIATGGGRGSRALPRKINASSYAKAFGSYARALARVAPGVPLLGPALAEPRKNLNWVSKLLASPHPGLGAVTAHRYPYSQCSRPPARTYPTIARVLSENATAGMARTVRGAVELSARAGLPLRLTEINSVTCGGRRGVSDTFATALWAPDALFELLHAGVASASVHVRANAINMAFSLTRRGLVAHPLLYGMTLFSRMLGADSQLVALRLTTRRSQRIKAWAVRLRGDIMHVLLIDKGSHSALVGLHLPAAGRATVQRLIAPSVRSRSGVTLDGQRLDAQGRWQGKPATETIAPGAAGYQLKLTPYSAALVTLHLRPGALSGNRTR